MMPAEDIVSGGLRARFARPDDPAAAGVLVLPSVSGLGGHTGATLAQLAQAGFAALAWDPFGACDPGIEQKEKARIADAQEDAVVLEEHRHWLGYMQQELRLARIGTLGFCRGGRMSLLLAAADPRIAAVVAYYPTMRDPKPALVADPVPLMGGVACPVQIHQPGADELTSRASFERLRAALKARSSGTTSIYFHPGAGHGFVSRAGQPGPDANAAAIAWPATVAFLQAALLPQESGSG